MEDNPVWEPKLLKGLCFKDDDQLRRYLHKLCSFFQSLDEPEKRVFLASLPGAAEALLSFRLEITVTELEDFLREREEPFGGVIVNVHKIVGCDDDDDDDDQIGKK